MSTRGGEKGACFFGAQTHRHVCRTRPCRPTLTTEARRPAEPVRPVWDGVPELACVVITITQRAHILKNA